MPTPGSTETAPPPAAPGRAGPAPAGELLSSFRCAGCGYGACCKIAPDRCPMCGGATWEYQRRRRGDSTSPSTASLNGHGRL